MGWHHQLFRQATAPDHGRRISHFLISILAGIYLLVMKILGQTGQGLSFIAISIWLIGGIQMLSAGIVGEYICKIYSEVKARPRFIVEKEI